MKIFNTVLVGPTSHQENAGAVAVPSDPHGHSNLSVLSRITVDSHGVLLFDGQPVDTVGQEFVNASILEQFSVVDGKLYFAGNPVDTAGSVFDNDAVLRLFSQSEDGTLLFNGLPIEGGSGTSLPNAEDLARLAVNADGQLTLDGAVVGGSGGAVTLSVTKLGSGTALLKGIVGSDLQTRSLVAGSNVTLDVSGDEIKINASLSGAVSSATTFKASDGYTNSSTISNNAETRIAGAEASTSESGLLFLARLGSDVKSSITDVALPITGSVTPASALASAPNAIATAFSNGKLTIPNGTTYTATSPATWFAGTVDWTIEFDFWRSSANQGTLQNIVSGWNATYANSSVWCGFTAANLFFVTACYGSTASTATIVTAPTAITDTGKHHIEVNRSGGLLRLFIDGALIGTASLTGSINAGAGFAVGNSQDSVAPFYGYLRNVKVYNYAKHTAAYTVPGYYADKVGAVNTVSMAGKLLSASFWKQISSLSVVSTETETSYLKWLLLDSNGLWSWDAANKVWVSSTLANILTSGMTTAALKTALTNNNWNYRSDTIGFAVAFVTDGTTSPVLTSLTLNAIQSADKTAAHTVLNSDASAMPQRTQLQFKNAVVSDDGTHTVVTVPKDTEDMTHGQSTLAAVISDLVSYKGTIGGKATDFSSGLSDGAILVYDSVSAKFKTAQPASGASGNGLYMTAPFTIAPGQEVTVSHQSVNNGRAVYQADRVIAGAAETNANRMFNSYDATLSSLDSYTNTPARSVAKLVTSHGSSVQSVGPNLPVACCGGCSYTVDDYIYFMPMVTANWATISSIYRAPVSAPNTWTLLSDTISMTWPVGGQVFRYGNTLFMFSAGVFAIADVSAPTKWTYPTMHSTKPAVNSCGAFMVGSKFWIVTGWNTSAGGALKTIYSIDLSQGFGSAWTQSASTFPVTLIRPACYQYGGYLYLIGGENTLDTTYSSAIYRASVSDPTTWTQIGSYPVACSFLGACVVKHGKVYIVGGRISGNSIASAYMANASNPTAWSALTSLPATRFFVGMIETWDGFAVVGGFSGGSISTAYATNYKYTLTPSISTLSGVALMNPLNVSLMQSMLSPLIIANIPAGCSITAAIAIDGVWQYYNGTAWVAATDMSAALASAPTLTETANANEYNVAGLSLNLNNSVFQLALSLVGTASATPELYSVTYNYTGRDTYSPLLISGYDSAFGDLGLKHVQGTYSTTNVKNKTASEMTVVLKVYDGAL